MQPVIAEKGAMRMGKHLMNRGFESLGLTCPVAYACICLLSSAQAVEVKNDYLAISAEQGDGAVLLKSVGGTSVQIALIGTGEKEVRFDKIKTSGETIIASGAGGRRHLRWNRARMPCR
jgi:hypothetical protein